MSAQVGKVATALLQVSNYPGLQRFLTLLEAGTPLTPELTRGLFNLMYPAMPNFPAFLAQYSTQNNGYTQLARYEFSNYPAVAPLFLGG